MRGKVNRFRSTQEESSIQWEGGPSFCLLQQLIALPVFFVAGYCFEEGFDGDFVPLGHRT